MPIDYFKERLIIGHMILAITRRYGRAYYPGMGWAASQELQTLAWAVFIGQAEGRPMTASALARYIGMPRASTLRKLNALVRIGYVAKTGRTYSIDERILNAPQVTGEVRKNIALIKAAAKKLTRLDVKST